MIPSPAWPWPPGYRVLRLLSEGSRAVVALAAKAGGDLVVLKLQRLLPDQNPDEALNQLRQLQPLTAGRGLLPITGFGLAGDRGWIWEELVAASSLGGSPPSASEDYQPATLRSELIEQGRFSTEAVVAIGLTLCAALERLHASGWVHRDVKPGNLLRVQGQVVLGDYGLTAAPGSPFDFKGTEGFIPGEGAGAEGGDLYALGKTLYELWTGCDRLEFPTVPRVVLDDPHWTLHGSLLNKVLLRACSPQARDRFATAAQFASALQRVAQGRPAWVRQQRWIAAGVAATALAALASLALFWPRPLSVRWERDSGVTVTLEGRAESGALFLYQAGESRASTNRWTLVAQTNTPLPARLQFPDGILASNPPPVPFKAAHWPGRPLESIAPSNMVLVPAGAVALGETASPGAPAAAAARRVDVAGFYLDRQDVTVALWDEVAGWANRHGYDLQARPAGPAPGAVVDGVTWPEAVKWCNARSEREGRVPAYFSGREPGQIHRRGSFVLRQGGTRAAGGYRLPTEAEWAKARMAGWVGPEFPWGGTNTAAAADPARRRASAGFRTVLAPEAHGKPPEWLLPPSPQASEPGGSVRFAGAASGTAPLFWQWRRDGRPLPAATNAILVRSPVMSADAGDYDVVVANAHGRATSRVARLTLLTVPVVSEHPVSRTHQAGAVQSFAVAATGAAPLHYQWRRDGRDLPGAIEARLELGAVTPAEAGAYAVVVSNRFGSVTSRVAQFTVVNFLPPDPVRLAWVPPGRFAMGDALGEGHAQERPVHPVTLAGFFMDRLEVTRAFWEEVRDWATNHGYQFEGGATGKGPGHPVHSVTWHDAVKWCNARSEREGRVPAYYLDEARTRVYRTGEVAVANGWVRWTGGYRLPTEAEWERAVRGGGDGLRFPWGDTITHALANYRSDTNHDWDTSSTRNFHPAHATGSAPYTSPAGAFGTNAFGLHDLVGNVREWCWDWRGDGYYAESPELDPRGPESGSLRVVRGGAWIFNASICRSAARGSRSPSYKDYGLGFRAVLAPPAP